MAESDSSMSSSLQDSNSDDSQSTSLSSVVGEELLLAEPSEVLLYRFEPESLSSVVGEELLLAEPSEVLLYRFEPEYDSRLEERGESSGLLEVVPEDTETDRVGNVES